LEAGQYSCRLANVAGHRLGTAEVGSALVASYAAIDPDAQIASLDKRAATERAEHDTRVTLGAAVDLTDMVAGLIAVGSRTDDERSLDAQQDLEREAQRRVEDDDYESTVADLQCRLAARPDRGRGLPGVLLEMAGEAEEVIGAPVDFVLQTSLERSGNRLARVLWRLTSAAQNGAEAARSRAYA
jgi:hypothetical protein